MANSTVALITMMPAWSRGCNYDNGNLQPAIFPSIVGPVREFAAAPPVVHCFLPSNARSISEGVERSPCISGFRLGTGYMTPHFRWHSGSAQKLEREARVGGNNGWESTCRVSCLRLMVFFLSQGHLLFEKNF